MINKSLLIFILSTFVFAASAQEKTSTILEHKGADLKDILGLCKRSLEESGCKNLKILPKNIQNKDGYYIADLTVKSSNCVISESCDNSFDVITKDYTGTPGDHSVCYYKGKNEKVESYVLDIDIPATLEDGFQDKKFILDPMKKAHCQNVEIDRTQKPGGFSNAANILSSNCLVLEKNEQCPNQSATRNFMDGYKLCVRKTNIKNSSTEKGAVKGSK